MKEITELGLIAALITLGFAPRERRKEGKQVIFIFDPDSTDELKKLNQYCEDYYNHRLFVDAYNMHMTLKQVKSSIFQNRMNNIIPILLISIPLGVLIAKIITDEFFREFAWSIGGVIVLGMMLIYGVSLLL